MAGVDLLSSEQIAAQKRIQAWRPQCREARYRAELQLRSGKRHTEIARQGIDGVDGHVLRTLKAEIDESSGRHIPTERCSADRPLGITMPGSSRSVHPHNTDAAIVQAQYQALGFRGTFTGTVDESLAAFYTQLLGQHADITNHRPLTNPRVIRGNWANLSSCRPKRVNHGSWTVTLEMRRLKPIPVTNRGGVWSYKDPCTASQIPRRRKTIREDWGRYALGCIEMSQAFMRAGDATHAQASLDMAFGFIDCLSTLRNSADPKEVSEINLLLLRCLNACALLDIISQRIPAADEVLEAHAQGKSIEEELSLIATELGVAGDASKPETQGDILIKLLAIPDPFQCSLLSTLMKAPYWHNGKHIDKESYAQVKVQEDTKSTVGNKRNAMFLEDPFTRLPLYIHRRANGGWDFYYPDGSSDIPLPDYALMARIRQFVSRRLDLTIRFIDCKYQLGDKNPTESFLEADGIFDELLNACSPHMAANAYLQLHKVMMTHGDTSQLDAMRRKIDSYCPDGSSNEVMTAWFTTKYEFEQACPLDLASRLRDEPATIVADRKSYDGHFYQAAIRTLASREADPLKGVALYYDLPVTQVLYPNDHRILTGLLFRCIEGLSPANAQRRLTDCLAKSHHPGLRLAMIAFISTRSCSLDAASTRYLDVRRGSGEVAFDIQTLARSSTPNVAYGVKAFLQNSFRVVEDAMAEASLASS